MKRRQLIQYLKKNGCSLLREGSNHSVYYNPVNGKVSAVPRHSEIADLLARKICRDLGVNDV
jgi:mRNA interferase HicA